VTANASWFDPPSMRRRGRTPARGCPLCRPACDRIA
jgi:hypothetical protein